MGETHTMVIDAAGNVFRGAHVEGAVQFGLAEGEIGITAWSGLKQLFLEDRMDEVFLRQSDAWQFVRSLEEPTDRLLVELALAKALSTLVADPDYRGRFKQAPLDLLTFAKAVHSFLCQHDIIRGVLEGKIKTVDDLNPFPST